MNKNRIGNKQNRKSKFKVFLAGALKWIAMLSCVALLIVALSPLMSNIYQSNKPSSEDKLLSAGIGIIGLAIAVWGGLNIANSIERKDLEELRSRTDSIKQLVYNMDNIESLEYDAFLQALLRTKNDELTAYFYRKFSRYSINTKENFFTLTRIEDLFGQVLDLHNTKDHYDKELIEKAGYAISCIEDYHTSDRLITTYLSLRNAEFHYYCGYVGESGYQKFQDFSFAFELYLNTLPELDITFPKRKKDGQIPELPDGIDRKLAIYMANTLGDTCSMILPLKKQLTSPSASKEQHRRYPRNSQKLRLTSPSASKEQEIEKSVLAQYAENAIFYCGCAVKWADGYSDKEIDANDYHYFEVYYRNYAVAYERYDAFFEQELENSETIISNYLESFYHIVKGTKITSQRVQSVYHALLSYLKRYFEAGLKFEHNDESKSPLLKEEVFKFARQYSTGFDRKQAEYLQNMLDISKIGMMDTPRNNLPIVMNGFASGYVIILKLVGNTEVCGLFSEDYSVYLANIQNALSLLNALNIQDPYTDVLRNRRQLITECVKQPV